MPPDVLSRKTCLVVEHDGLLASAFQLVIDMTESWICHLASSETVALEYLGQRRPDVALIDCDGSGEASMRLATALLAKDVPVAFLSTDPDNGFPSPFSTLCVIAKPTPRHALLRALDVLAGSPAGPPE